MSDSVRPARPHQKLTEDGRRLAEVLSYSRRGSRFTPKQAEAWDAHHEAWVIPDEAVDVNDFDLDAWFGRKAPLAIEIGSGVGEATAALAASRPDMNVLALEVWVPGVADSLRRLDEAGVNNVRFCSIDAVWFFENILGPDAITELWTFFPDPWHKKKHNKRRLVNPAFADLVSRRLVPGGEWRLATDWLEYAEQMQEVLDASPSFAGGVVPRWDERPVTKFERKGLAKDRVITDLLYRTVAAPQGEQA
ncbi:tRNA (guanosine(46)-N7)-methyltransferase TrmB [Nocardioides yefusunii]|uniref:tRNA (guanine-N(7)-)-methyltransferase n=1 Tax=Nocardioides yefusunii TaxID=2500546 RepID=A0ABW1QYZ5_9ACTN|nr:tRNA (guanosine(46)-N7)-methyltransferase TrmB [Nocardioides yefusunii]